MFTKLADWLQSYTLCMESQSDCLYAGSASTGGGSQAPAEPCAAVPAVQQPAGVLAFDPAAAGLLLYATADAGPHLSNPAAQPLSDSLDDLSSSTMVSRAPAAAVAGDTQGSGQHTGALDALWPQQGSQSAPMLPRMPAGLAHAGSQQCYEALAAVARSIGRVAYQSGLPSVLPLHSLLRHTYQDYTYALKIAELVGRELCMASKTLYYLV